MHSEDVDDDIVDGEVEESYESENKPLINEEEEEEEISGSKWKDEIVEFDFFVTVCVGIMNPRYFVYGSNEILENVSENQMNKILDTSPQEYSYGSNVYVSLASNSVNIFCRIDYRCSEEDDLAPEVVEEFVHSHGKSVHSFSLEYGEVHNLLLNERNKDIASVPTSLTRHSSSINKPKKKKENIPLVNNIQHIFTIANIVTCFLTSICWSVCCIVFLIFVITFSAAIPNRGWRIVLLFFTGMITVILSVPCCCIRWIVLSDFTDDILRRTGAKEEHKEDDNSPRSIREIAALISYGITHPKKAIPDNTKPLNTLENNRWISKEVGEGIGIVFRVFGSALVCASVNLWCILILIGYLLVFREIQDSDVVRVAFGVILPCCCIFCVACLFLIPLFGYFIELHYSVDSVQVSELNENENQDDGHQRDITKDDFEEI